MNILIARLLALALLVMAAAASAQSPAKPIRLIVTYPRGGGAATMARIIAPRLTERLRQPVANTPQEAAVFLIAGIAKWATAAKQANIKAEQRQHSMFR